MFSHLHEVETLEGIERIDLFGVESVDSQKHAMISMKKI